MGTVFCDMSLTAGVSPARDPRHNSAWQVVRVTVGFRRRELMNVNAMRTPNPTENDMTDPTNREKHEALVADLRDLLARTAEGGPEKARQRHVDRGKLLPRQRITELLDPGSPFLEV